jgi:hypothetical protein
MLDRVFIRNHHHTKQAMKFKGRVFNDKGQAREPKGRTRNNCHVYYSIQLCTILVSFFSIAHI